MVVFWFYLHFRQLKCGDPTVSTSVTTMKMMLIFSCVALCFWSVSAVYSHRKVDVTAGVCDAAVFSLL